MDNINNVEGMTDKQFMEYKKTLLILVLEDSKAGVIAGSSAGAKVIMVPDMFKPDEVCKEKVYRIVNNLGEVISILEEKNNENFNR